ncbi:hypothetical protein A3K34_01865 [candidate division WWE3 bacterium RIFOXYC1_FULL_40_10]|uniref:SGNH hydrolase-type esterase domain-containing protein n=1 Tax=candidate division WWE3 bacterium RIFOXYA2_FULL_46_9 TaxID=1802636 RepID=A0A1F4W2L3_UNCKA|nr:MAG: hypothetical protein A3K58_01865 [candidate division WWE3 bacterium RIFOXYB1_FULL_40_22]OGC61609.1 MAG: hypothetical protein A3K37_01865 [candidate division WWE3 bacterium RIFOXYA1_FULL_40_11]OGC63656.1 MAG: hypothetical protein A2264_04810 [candidate division WWE3 bacterium RIFOXYA2_FULL_46_9]OGC64712.1 MAG: hypothetical protein A2326_01580 [candidate division WWE3 bacterium RIFOXYB2_FULL_41_6]OGC65992.1 MAG: hypothetical protein A3K34_01865 [candidate division WWE3 bacterium RIFOXYC1_
MRAVKIITVFTLVLCYLYFSYARFYNYIGELDLRSPYTTKAFDIDNPLGNGFAKYVALGDSLSAGVGSLDTKNTFVYDYALKLSSTYQKVSVVNLGEPGATTYDLINRQLPEAILAQPDYITLLIGTNDIHCRSSAVNFERNYSQILQELLSKTNAQIIVINLPYLGSEKIAYPPYNLVLDFRTKQFNRIISSLVDSDRLKLVDLYEASYDFAKNSPDFYSTDLFHPSDTGYALWGKLINAY